MGKPGHHGTTWIGVRRSLWVTLAALLICALSQAMAQQSSRFVMERVSVSAVSGTASSSRFTTSAVIAHSPVAGGASHCNDGFVSGVGFWPLSGSVSVPILLQVSRKQSEPGELDLVWSGADPAFRVFRSTTPQDVSDPANLLIETPSCSHVESGHPVAGVVFYRVLAAPK